MDKHMVIFKYKWASKQTFQTVTIGCPKYAFITISEADYLSWFWDCTAYLPHMLVNWCTVYLWNLAFETGQPLWSSLKSYQDIHFMHYSKFGFFIWF